jgi:acyl dehydratase
MSRLSADAVKIAGDFKMGINYGLNRVRFTGPVPANSRIRSHMTLQGFEEFSGGCQVTWAVTMEVEGSPKPALVAEWLVRLYR